MINTEKITSETILLEARKAKNQEILDDICCRYKGHEDLVLVLGAGVSVPAGLPAWSGLVSRLFGYSLLNVRHKSNRYRNWELKNEYRKIEDEIIVRLASGNLSILGTNNVLETGQYVEQMLDGRNNISWIKEEVLKEALSFIIKDGKSAQKRKNELAEILIDELTKQPIDFLDRNNFPVIAEQDTLLAVAYALSRKESFHRAITYNYDTFVEEYMQEFYQVPNSDIIVHCDGWNTSGDKNARTEIIHVHGCIPTEYYKTNNLNICESRKIILSEDSYYNVEKDETYNWMNSVQSYILNKESCIFIGFSGEDYNFRRILRQLNEKDYEGDLSFAHKSSHPDHYMFVTIEDLYNSILDACKKNWVNDSENYAKVLLDRVLIAKEEYWIRYGIYPIWVTKEEIPKKILSFM